MTDETTAKENILLLRSNSLLFSRDGTFALFCESEAHCIRSMCVKTGEISTFAGVPGLSGHLDGLSSSSRFHSPEGLTFSPDGTFVLVCDYANHCIRKICLDSKQVTTFAGIPGLEGSRNGPKEQALFDIPIDITFSPDSTFVLVCDPGTHCSRKICLESGQVSTFAGSPEEGEGHRNGPKEQAVFEYPRNLIFTPDGKTILICDQNSVRSIKIKN
jgi:DNA-binding beta-propeller fold protein YncE